MTDATYSRSLTQTNSLRIRQSSLLTGNGMVAPGRRHANLIPSHPFAGRIAASVQHRGNLVVAVANSHTTNDLQRLHRRGGFRCGTRPLHRELRMRASLPVNHQLEAPFILVSDRIAAAMALCPQYYSDAVAQLSSSSLKAFEQLTNRVGQP